MNPLPPGWLQEPLGSIADVRLGRQRSPKNHIGENMKPYLRAANVNWDGLDLRDVNEMNFSAVEVDTYRLEPGDVLVAEASGSQSQVGKPAIWRGEIADCCFQNTLLRVRSKALVPEYLRYFLLGEALSSRLGQAARGVGIHHLGAAGLSSYVTPVPPTAEQRRIVAAIEEQFSRLDAAKELLRRVRLRLESLRSATVSAAVAGPWPAQSLGEIGDPTRKIAYGVLQPGIHVTKGTTLVRVGDILNGSIRLGALKAIDPGIADRYPRTRLRGGEVVLTIVGTIGRSAVVPASLDGANVARAVAVIPTGEDVLAEFVSLALTASDARARLAGLAHEVARKTLNLEDVRSFQIPVPPIAEQRRIVTRAHESLAVIDAVSVDIAASERRSEHLRMSVLSSAFAGRLVAQDPSDEPASVLLDRIAADRKTVPRDRLRKVKAG